MPVARAAPELMWSAEARYSLAALSKWERGLFHSVRLPQRLGAKQSVVDAMQALDHARRQQLVVMNFQQVINDEPDRLFRGHPCLIVKPCKIQIGRASCRERV